MKKGFTLIELLAVIVILAIIAIIAIPIILGIIDDTKKQADIRSAEIYLSAVEMAVAKENLNTKNKFDPIQCSVMTEETKEEGYKVGDLDCDIGNISVKVDHPATGGAITFENGKIISVIELKINNSTFDFINGNLELLKEYKVTFDTSGGSSIETQTVLESRLANIPTSNPTKEGYIFKGWTLNNQGFDFNTPITSNITLKAKWESEVVYILTTGREINARIKTLARGSSSNYSTQDTTVKTISFYSNGNLPEGYTLDQLQSLQSTDLSNNSKKKIMAYWDGNGNIYVYSEGKIAMNSYTGTSSSGNQTFWQFRGVTTIDLSQVDTSNAKYMAGMFANCLALTSLDLSNFNTSNVTGMENMFAACSNLTSITFSSNFNTSNVTSMESMFQSCSSLTSLDLSAFNTPSLTITRHMFANCSRLSKIDLSNAELGEVTGYLNMFASVPRSVPIYLKDTEDNRNFMNTNFSSRTVTYITPTE